MLMEEGMGQEAERRVDCKVDSKVWGRESDCVLEVEGEVEVDEGSGGSCVPATDAHIAEL